VCTTPTETGELMIQGFTKITSTSTEEEEEGEVLGFKDDLICFGLDLIYLEYLFRL
jgi:hypothetical protein